MDQRTNEGTDEWTNGPNGREWTSPPPPSSAEEYLLVGCLVGVIRHRASDKQGLVHYVTFHVSLVHSLDLNAAPLRQSVAMDRRD